MKIIITKIDIINSQGILTLIFGLLTLGAPGFKNVSAPLTGALILLNLLPLYLYTTKPNDDNITKIITETVIKISSVSSSSSFNLTILSSLRLIVSSSPSLHTLFFLSTSLKKLLELPLLFLLKS